MCRGDINNKHAVCVEPEDMLVQSIKCIYPLVTCISHIIRTIPAEYSRVYFRGRGPEHSAGSDLLLGRISAARHHGTRIGPGHHFCLYFDFNIAHAAVASMIKL